MKPFFSLAKIFSWCYLSLLSVNICSALQQNHLTTYDLWSINILFVSSRTFSHQGEHAKLLVSDILQPEILIFYTITLPIKNRREYSMSIHIIFDDCSSLGFWYFEDQDFFSNATWHWFFVIIDQIFGIARLSLDPSYLLFGLHFRILHTFSRLFFHKMLWYIMIVGTCKCSTNNEWYLGYLFPFIIL